MLVKADPEDLMEVITDDRGRPNLGIDYANKKLEIAIVSVEEKDE